MKKITYIFFLLFFAFNLIGQTPMPPPSNEEIFTIAEQMPEFPGGKDSLSLFIQKNLKYPESAINAGLSGKCYVKFVVTETGAVERVEVLKGVPGCPECDREAVRVIKHMPKWRPGQMTGQPVKVFYTMPISFVLQTTGK